ncbi:AAA family ATPase [Caballeronia sordidicola]|uniref:RecF protein n=1 Tax=Caballeronia sordidicola TaxID=196367 RepID=A0A226WTB8_CABSO|nr:AAA family ATPase [Caballeronia sordidicola]OXC74363.1 RecF protein [Caballeronia sordidicola]
MIISNVRISGYRSLRSISFPIGQLSVFVGENGTGKTNLYRSLQLIQAAANGSLATELAREGGMASAIWAGERARGEKARIILSVTLCHPVSKAPCYEYECQVGFVQPPPSPAFPLEPQIREEKLVDLQGRTEKILLHRKNSYSFTVNAKGEKNETMIALLASETLLASLKDPINYPDLHAVRSSIQQWAFFHEFRTDSTAPLRQPGLPITSPTLFSNGNNLSAVFATLKHIRQDTADLDEAINDAFPGAQLIVPFPETTTSFGVLYPEYPHRVFAASELSDGTLRFLALAGALFSYRLPPFIAFNEPENSLHPSLIPALARMIRSAAENTQIWLVTHSNALAEALAESAQINATIVYKSNGQTWLKGLSKLGSFR